MFLTPARLLSSEFIAVHYTLLLYSGSQQGARLKLRVGGRGVIREITQTDIMKHMVNKVRQQGLINALLVSNLVSIVLFGFRVFVTNNTVYWFLFWNLLLAWVPVLVVWILLRTLKRRSWKEPLPLVLTFVWLGFLPNSFYLMSDLIHLRTTGDIGLLFDIVLFLSCIWNGAVAGMLSIFWVHIAILKRTTPTIAASLIGIVMVLASFAVYLGRSLRWNTWDVLVNPAGILFDVSERVINPLDHPQVIVTTLTFTALLGSMYLVIWQFWLVASSHEVEKLKN